MGIDARMIVVTTNKPSKEDIKRWSYIFGSAFAQDLFLGFEDTIYNKPIELIKNTVDQDGPDFVIDKDKTILEIPLPGRYYGEGYERGNLLTYIYIAEFLEQLIPESIIYYGEDSSGVLFEQFDQKRRKELLEYYIKVNGRDPYVRGFDAREKSPTPICPVCDVNMFKNGWGNKYALFTCSGCGWKQVERDGKVSKGFTVKEL
jgi:hypothetical protein